MPTRADSKRVKASIRILPCFIAHLSFVNTGYETFAVEFVHDARIDEFLPVALLFDLHELEKDRRVFGPRVGNSRKDL
jgi:hypothetical protein